MNQTNSKFYLGIDLNDHYAMISYFNTEMPEPQTASVIAGSEDYLIPLLLAKRKEMGQWYFGEEALKRAKKGELICVDNLLKRAVGAEKILIDGQTYQAQDLLALFLRKIMEIPSKLGNLQNCDKLVITVDKLTKENMKMFWNLLPKLGLNSKQFMVIDHKEIFYYFALNQDKTLWIHDIMLYDYDGIQLKYYHLNRNQKTIPQVISIFESKKTDMESDVDKEFSKVVQTSMDNKVVSTVYLVGEGFNENWMKSSLSLLCRGRRVFAGKNLYTKGACYAAKVSDDEENWPFVYMGENEMKFNLSLKVKDKGELSFLNLISAGKNWFESKGECEVIISGAYEIDFWKQLPNSREAKIETLELTDMPARPDRTTRVRITATPLSDEKIAIDIKDLGFGDIFRSSDKTWHYEMTM